MDKKNITSRLIILATMLLSILSIDAQTPKPKKALMNQGEVLTYTAEFQWGLLKPDAGSATMSMREVHVDGKDLYAYKIALRTSSFFDKIYYLRDEVESFFTPDLKFIKSIKKLNERKKPSTRYMTMTYNHGKPVKYRFYKERRGNTMRDTTITLDSKYPVVDLFGSVIFLRSLDAKNLRVGDKLTITVIDNADITTATIVYKGKVDFKVNKKNKYHTLKFVVDIKNNKFEKQKESMEAWISDDENLIPICLKSKLKLGAGVVTFKGAKGLKYPLTSKF
ncbi:DUF3108 domain-containing protein [Falsiporphyromonas endometrii]|uniref:DUF3108 domain-containing protein n=1 Tax=Falsiporphyromonas endometrii TaxID=1387297 RepID=A0ABV9K8A3_9PORP